MNDDQLIEGLTLAVNMAVDIPFVGEETEGKWFASIIAVIVPHIPQDVRPLLIDAADGLTAEEIDRHAEAITELVVDQIDDSVPFFARPLVRPALRGLVGPAVRRILSFAKVGQKLVLA